MTTGRKAPQRWQQVRQIYEAALERTGDDRNAWLRTACATDPTLRSEVESLLEHEPDTAAFLETTVASVAAAVLPHGIGGEPAGRRIGRYTIASWLDAGGMGDVYRGRDSTLERDVAIKVLPREFAGDTERVARFRREAHVLGTLNHPNIATIYGFEDADDVLAIILELVDGSTLAQLLARKKGGGPTLRGASPSSGRGLAIGEALGLARQIADALEAAHDKGVVHRDLKPANVMVRLDGTVKVLDFGLAAAFGVHGRGIGDTRPPPSGDPLPAVFGTPAYVSPEQAHGQEADKRTDIWAFGCVLYEMLTGRSAFGGATTSETIAAVLERQPDLTALPGETPDGIRRLLRRCLEKHPTHRLRDMGDARLEIVEALATLGEAAVAMEPVSSRGWSGRATSATLAIVSTAALGLLVMRSTPLPAASVVRFTLTAPAAFPVASLPMQNVAISADGTHLAYRSHDTIVVRPLDQVDLIPLSGVEPGQPFFLSTNGTWLGLVDSDGLKKAPVAGGPTVSVAAATVAAPGFLAGASGARWDRDDVIVFADDNGLSRVPAADGVPERLIHSPFRESRERLAWPELLPGGGSVLFTMIPEGTGEAGAQIQVLDLKNRSRKPLVYGGTRGRYVPTGHLLYASRNTLYAVAFDLGRLEVRGKPVAVVAKVLNDSFAVSDTGTLAYLSGVSVANTLVWVSRDGREDPFAVPPGAYIYPRLSPNGRRVAVDSASGPNRDIWIWDIGRETWDFFTANDASLNPVAAWSPEGTRLAFGSARHGVPNLFLQSADGSGRPERLLESPVTQIPLSFTADGRYLIFAEQNAGREWDQMAVSLDEPRRVIPLLQTAASEMSAEVSPNGRWFAYSSDESGRHELYVRSFPDSDRERRTVSSSGGKQPQWSRDGSELFYLSQTGAMVAVRVSETPELSVSQPVELFADAGYGHMTGARSYDLAADGRFLMVKTPTPTGTSSAGSIEIVHNWFEELKRLVPPAP